MWYDGIASNDNNKEKEGERHEIIRRQIETSEEREEVYMLT